MVDAKADFGITRHDIGVNLPARAADPVEFAVAQELAFTAQADFLNFAPASFHNSFTSN
jgi:hypothetical protein